ncbi:MAG: hypothetical protein F6J93_22540 [Oscillatoria sp. SIO1A7]|nr:hypothetical protein [Oscillatoria sp. SIO1A7]
MNENVGATASPLTISWLQTAISALGYCIPQTPHINLRIAINNYRRDADRNFFEILVLKISAPTAANLSKRRAIA